MNINIDWDNLTKIIDDCPQIPQPPVVERINPPPYAQPRILLGMAKDEDDKGKKKSKPTRADLPEHLQSTHDAFVKQGVMKSEEYIQGLIEVGEIQWP